MPPSPSPPLFSRGARWWGIPRGVPRGRPGPPGQAPEKEPRSPYGNPPEYEVRGITYHVLKSAKGYDQEGVASWYGPEFQGKRTSSGEPYDMYAMTAAHKTLPIPTYVEVTNLENGQKVVVRVNDRGPFQKNRLIDLSYIAALKLGMLGAGTARVRVRALTPGGSTP
jgi:rare lipoprotein A